MNKIDLVNQESVRAHGMKALRHNPSFFSTFDFFCPCMKKIRRFLVSQTNGNAEGHVYTPVPV